MRFPSIGIRTIGTFLADTRRDLQILRRMISAYRSGAYRRIPWRGLAFLVGAAAYLLLPLDLIPDFILGLGILDDATVFGLALAAARREITAFARWEEEHLRAEGNGSGGARASGPTGRPS